MADSKLKTNLHQFCIYCISNHLPFAFYHLPGTGVTNVLAQNESKLNKVNSGVNYTGQKGFLFAPFKDDARFSRILIKPDIFTTESKLPELNFASGKKAGQSKPAGKLSLKETGKEEFKRYVKKAIKAIGKGDFQKVVVARILKKKKPADFEVVKFYKELCRIHPNAFVSLVFTPEYGLWVGATPEILLHAGDKEFTTYALAGTKPNTIAAKKELWGKKEQLEQQIVSDYIVQTFKSVTKTKASIAGPETVPAGNLLHLQTTFTYRSIPKDKWQQVVEKLHPTPAVGGSPKKAAIQFISKHEKFERGFYSGYLGPVNLNDEINLFVNLRCMQVLKNRMVVHTGCGITAGSQPDKEWKETTLKAHTLLDALNGAKPKK